MSSRRTFLKSAAAVAAPMIVPSTVFGPTAPSNRVNLAAIGVGNRGGSNVFEDYVKTQDDVRVVAACDCFASRRTAFAAKVDAFYGGTYCTPTADWRDILRRDDIDGLVISTPDHWHVPLAYHAALAKKDTYVEKPLGVSMAWAFKLREAVAKSRVIFQYGTQQRSSSEFPDVVFDPETRTVYVTSSSTNEVLAFDENGTPKQGFNPQDDQKLENPSSMTILTANKKRWLLVVNSGGNRVSRFELEAATKTDKTDKVEKSNKSDKSDK